MRPAFIWLIISVIVWLAGWFLKDSIGLIDMPFPLYFFGWISMFLSIGYLSTPQNSIFGKIAFGFVIVMVTGIAFKMLHLPGGNEIILFGLVGLLATYITMWMEKKK